MWEQEEGWSGMDHEVVVKASQKCELVGVLNESEDLRLEQQTHASQS